MGECGDDGQGARKGAKVQQLPVETELPEPRELPGGELHRGDPVCQAK